jgi:hypothetical protein
MSLLALLLLILVIAVGLWAAWMTGRAAALTWRPYWMAALYFLPLTFAFRFLFFIFTQGHFVTLLGIAGSLVFIFVVGSVAYQFTRAGLMTRQYPWLYERTSPFTYQHKRQNG